MGGYNYSRAHQLLYEGLSKQKKGINQTCCRTVLASLPNGPQSTSGPGSVLEDWNRLV
jgi:hypothetical protein